MPVTIADDVLAAAHLSEPEMRRACRRALSRRAADACPEGVVWPDGPVFVPVLARRSRDSDPLRHRRIPRRPSNGRRTPPTLIVVSDTAPLLSLARIGRLDLLEALAQEVLIPPTVFEELKAGMRSWSARSIAFDQLSWIVIASPRDRSARQEAFEPGSISGAGGEAIVLALERHADLLLVDERRGRQTARASGLNVTGLLGVVIQAKHAGLIDAAKPILDDLVSIGRFWVGLPRFMTKCSHNSASAGERETLTNARHQRTAWPSNVVSSGRDKAAPAPDHSSSAGPLNGRRLVTYALPRSRPRPSPSHKFAIFLMCETRLSLT